MKRMNKVILGTFAAVSVALLPFEVGPTLTIDVAAAHAKGGNGGGNGGKGGGSGGSKGSSASSHGKSASTKGKGNAFGNQVAQGTVGKSSIFKTEKSNPRTKSAKAIASANGQKSKHVKVALPDSVPMPDTKPQNFHAKLAALNSLNRNYHAYLNSKSPRFAAIAAFVKASAEYELALDAVARVNGDLVAAQEEFTAAVDAAGIKPYDDNISVYQNASVESLTARLEALRTAQQSVQSTELDAEIAALEGLLSGTEAKAVVDNQAELERTELDAETLAVGTDDEALREALLDMANENRVAQYGDDYVDTDMMDWAKEVLGVDEAFGKIDQVKEVLSTTDSN